MLSQSCYETMRREWAYLVQWLHEDVKSPGSTFIIDAIVKGYSKFTLRCLLCHHKLVRDIIFCQLTLKLPSGNGDFSIETWWRCTSCQRQRLEWMCPCCKAMRPKRSWTFFSILLICASTLWDSCDSESNWERRTWLTLSSNHSDIGSSQTYDLCGIINQRGKIESDHYTAKSLLPFYGQWYNFDDGNIFPIDSSRVKSHTANYLIYSARDKGSNWMLCTQEEHLWAALIWVSLLDWLQKWIRSLTPTCTKEAYSDINTKLTW